MVLGVVDFEGAVGVHLADDAGIVGEFGFNGLESVSSGHWVSCVGFVLLGKI